FQIIDEHEGQHLARIALREVLVAHPEYLCWLEVFGFDRVLIMCCAYQGFRREQGGLRAAGLNDIKAAAQARVKYWQTQFCPLVQETAESPDAQWLQFSQELSACVESWNHALPVVEHFPKKPRRSKKQV